MRPKPTSSLVLLIAFLAGPAHAAIPVPRPKPAPSAPVYRNPSLLVPMPRAKPGVMAKPATTTEKLWPREHGEWPEAEVQEARSHCMMVLASRNLIWRPDSPIGGPGWCGTSAPIAIAEVSGVRINPPGTLNCDFAVALGDWIDGAVQPLAQSALHSRVTEIRIAAAYSCRRRNNMSRGKLSEHAKANALDIASFKFADGSEITVKGQSTGLLEQISFSRPYEFIKGVRRQACRTFNTVLGPGSDRSHKDHMHVDIMPLRPGRFKLCR